MSKVQIDAEQLKDLVKLSRQRGTQEMALDLCVEWAEKATQRIAELEAQLASTQEKNAQYLHEMGAYSTGYFRTQAQLAEAQKLLAAVEPYMDSVICYASTLDEHDGNQVAKMIRDYTDAMQAEEEKK